jgi:NAD(P)H dehydrogenase (quinone)
VITRRLDYDDPASVDAALEGVDRLLLVSSSAVGQRVPQHRTVLEAAAHRGVELVAYTSILRARSSSLALAAEHVATERLLAELGLPHVLLRNGWYFENYTAQVPVHLEHGVLGAAGAGRISAAARADYAEAAAVALLADDSAGKVHELAGDDSFTMADYAATLAELSGQQVSYLDLSQQEYVAALVSAGVPAPFAEVLGDSDRGVAAGELFDDSRTLSNLIGRPTTPLADAVKAALV